MDFFKVQVRETKHGVEIAPAFRVGRSKDLMVRARAFYAIWDEERGLWSTDEYDVARLVDRELYAKAYELKELHPKVLSMTDYSTKSWKEYREFLSKLNDSAVELDGRIMFANEKIERTDYASHVLPYSLVDGDHSAFDDLLDKLYEPAEKEKLLWSIGAIVSGDSRYLQKFVVLYGKSGAGKSTVLNIVQGMFDGYCSPFDARALGNSSNQFALEPFRTNPLVAIQHDGDLSRIDDNTKLNSIVSHETIPINEKYKPQYYMRPNAFLMIGTNTPVKISDAKSGLIRRLIDISPTGETFSPPVYQRLIRDITTEYGAIARYCLDIFKKLGKHYYDDYVPVQMMFRTDVVFNFVDEISGQIMHDDGISLRSAYAQYKQYCADSQIVHILPMYAFKEDLKEYFGKFEERAIVNDERVRSWYSEFKSELIFGAKKIDDRGERRWIDLKDQPSKLDVLYEDCPAQYASDDGIPAKPWDSVTTKLKELDTSKEHFVRPPVNHIVVDFDLKNDQGEKSLEANIDAAEQWPRTYCETSRSGNGLHLHYVYDGDPTELANVYSSGVEIKTWSGKSSLRRKRKLVNDEPVAHISSGLPLKEKKVINAKTFTNEAGLRKLVEKNLRKEVHPGTKPSIDFIKHILDEAYKSGKSYDLNDMRGHVLAFAMRSTHHSEYCLQQVSKMHFRSGDEEAPDTPFNDNEPIVFYDVEVYPNLFLVCYKTIDGDCVSMVNPKPTEVENLINNRLIGFNNRRYDNHILYAAMMGYSDEQLFKLSQKIVSGDRTAMFREAYNLSYTDVYDFCSKKQSLKKWEIELGIHHQEMGIPWDEPCPEELWPKVIEYCCNDVKATQAVFNARQEDWKARCMLANIVGMTPNTTTNSITQQMVFGNDRNPKFIWTDLSKEFPGYEYKFGKSTYMGEEVGEGGYVYSEPGIYKNVALLDVASMHPHSIKALNLWGDEYTNKYFDLVQARIAIKHGELDKIKTMYDGKLAPYVSDDPAEQKILSTSLKIPINSMYGLTAAKFGNRANGNSGQNNKDNIVAKRGALFMVWLKHQVQERGFAVAHIKTDSIKIPDATPEIIEFVMDAGKKYGYTFEHEATYDRMCLVNDAVYIAHDTEGWHATGLQFQVPYVFKTLFSKEDIKFEDLCLTKSVSKGYIIIRKEDGDHFIGRVGSFCPVKNGGELLRCDGDKFYALADAKGHLWAEAEAVEDEDDVDMDFWYDKVSEAKRTIEKYGSFDEFVV